MRINNINEIIIGHLNINSIRNKFKYLKYLIVENIFVLLIFGTKLNNTFPQCQFLLDGFHTPYREDRTDKGGGLLLYVREHIPCANIKFNFCTTIEAIIVEINLKKRKWLLICSHNYCCSIYVIQSLLTKTDLFYYVIWLSLKQLFLHFLCISCANYIL